MKTLLLITLTLALVAPGYGQSDLKDKTKSFKNSKRFDVTYDRFEDETHVSAGPFLVKGLSLDMTATFQFEGPIAKKPVEFFLLIFESHSREWLFLNNRQGFAIVDDERIALGEGHQGGRVNSGYGVYRRSVSVTERLVFPVTPETFKKIANARSVDLRVGPYELSLKDEHLTAFRDLLSLAH